MSAELYDVDGRPLPASLALVESSGPVAPRFQFHTRIRLTADAEGVRIELDERRPGEPPSEPVKADVPRERYEQLWAALAQAQVFERSADLVGPERRARVGISVNRFELALGGRSVRFDYLLRQLEEEQYAPFAAVVSAVKSFAAQAAGRSR